MAYTSQYAQDEMAKSVAGPGKGDKKKAKQDKGNYVDAKGVRHTRVKF